MSYKKINLPHYVLTTKPRQPITNCYSGTIINGIGSISKGMPCQKGFNFACKVKTAFRMNLFQKNV